MCFFLSYETANGISAQEEGHLKNAGNVETEASEVRGSYKYTAPDGTLVSVTYIADENGFQPRGTHISIAGITRNLQETSGEISQLSGLQETTAAVQSTSERTETPQISEEEPVAVNGEAASEAEASLFRTVYRAKTGNYYNAQFRRS